MDTAELLLTAARAVAVYALMLLVVRALGKRTVGNFSAFDLLVALMLGEVVDEIVFGDVRFLQGTVAIVTIAAVAYADSWLVYSNRRMEMLIEGRPTVVVRDGEFDRTGMRRERMNETDVLGHLRAQGIVDMREVHFAIVEHDGSVSILKQPWAEPAQKADVIREEQKLRAATLRPGRAAAGEAHRLPSSVEPRVNPWIHSGSPRGPFSPTSPCSSWCASPASSRFATARRSSS
jgi:uncharacterized membrane protein YcaP (DUF421 family)